MHPNNYTLYQLIKFHIELTEAMEYTLITYKYNEGELKERFDFLKTDYKKGFFHEIVKTLFNKPKKLTKEVKVFENRFCEFFNDFTALSGEPPYSRKLELW